MKMTRYEVTLVFDVNSGEYGSPEKWDWSGLLFDGDNWYAALKQVNTKTIGERSYNDTTGEEE